MHWLASEVFWLRWGLCACATGVAAGVLARHATKDVSALVSAATGLAGAGFGVAIALRWTSSGQGPFLTLYEVIVSNLFTLSAIYLVARRVSAEARAIQIPYLATLTLLGTWALTVSRDLAPLPPTFDNGWLWVHVSAGKLFLALCLMAASASLILIVTRSRADGALDAFVWRAAAGAFVFEGGMLVAGSAWASDAWGRYWGWDPLETWALVTWLGLGALLHARVAFRVPPAIAWGAMCAVFVLAFLTFLGMPFFSVAPHKGVV